MTDISFKVEESKGLFTTTPQVMASLAPSERDYRCRKCKSQIEENQKMQLDMSKPDEGWWHLHPEHCHSTTPDPEC